jgi:hypothetical protein
VKLLVNNRSTSLYASQDAIVTTPGASTKVMQHDNIARRSVKTTDLGNGHEIARSDVSLTSVMENSPALANLIHSTNHADRAIASRLIKMAACMMMVTAKKGAYSKQKS